MRKILSVLLLAVLLCGAMLPATAETVAAVEPDSTETVETLSPPRRPLMLTGSIVAGETITMTAPFGGTLADFTVRKGDFVSAGDVLFTIETTKVYAPCDGVVGGVRAQVGDDASFVQERYGALLYLEPTNKLLVETDTKYAYADDANKWIHVGETVYIGSRNTNDRVGQGYVTSVNGEKYTIEITGGNLVLDDSVSIFRERSFANTSKIGSGTTTLNPYVAISGDGCVFRLNVQQGDTVKRGDVLLETVGGATEYNPFPTNSVVAGYDAIVASVDANAGASVQKAQTLATLYTIDGLQVSLDATESELQHIAVGDTVRIELASFYDQKPMTGKVVSISGLSESGSDEAEYTVTIDFKPSETVRLGMSVNVYFNE